MRSKGRISKNVSLTYDTVNPLILNKDCHFTNLIIKKFHNKCSHMGLNTTLNSIRRAGFWILKGRQAVSKVLKDCTTCKRINSINFKLPPVPCLPADRVNLIKPFDNTGVDYTGPFWVKDSNGVKTKFYILIFTCLNIRAVHFELLNSMSTEQFILAFIRFANRYALPKIIYSDNAKTFVASSSVLSDIMQSEVFCNKFSPYNIKFKFTPVYSPWVGAAWERLIKTLKTCLYKTIGRNIVDYFSFLTSLSDIQQVINSRPLTYNSQKEDVNIITPNDLLYPGHSYNSIFITNFNFPDIDVDDVKQNIVDSVEFRDILYDKFRNLFMDSYLLDLRDRHINSYTPENIKQSPFLRIGSIVLMKTPLKARPFWSFAKIIEFLPSSDGLVRSVKILKGGNLVVTSISNLYPLELDSNFVSNIEEEVRHETVSDSEESCSNLTGTVEQCNEEGNGKESEEDISPPDSRPIRKAALKFKKKLSNWLKNDSI